MNIPPLIQQADQAFHLGDNILGLEKLREFSQSADANALNWNRLAVVEEQVGEWKNAGIAHYQCIKCAPHIATSYLYAAYWLEQSKLIDAAASLYSLAQEADPGILTIAAATAAPQRAIRSQAGNKLLRSYLSEQHRGLFEKTKTTQRIKNAIWPQTHDQALSFNSAQFAPQLFYIPDLAERPYFEAEEFDWADELSNNSHIIKNELNAFLQKANSGSTLRPYIPKEFSGEPSLKKLAGSDEWSALDLYRNGELNEEISNSFPKTLGLMKQVPSYGLGSTPFEVFFSLLKPRQEISKHFGESNHSLTVHLALAIPNKCYLEVAGQKRKWIEDELTLFDDSFQHSAHNPSDQQRIVLIFSVWHPSLSDAEKHAIQLSFRTRAQWMTQRTSKIQSLIS